MSMYKLRTKRQADKAVQLQAYLKSYERERRQNAHWKQDFTERERMTRQGRGYV